MSGGRCPNCGSPMGAGALAGLCPKCLLAGESQGRTTEDAVAVLEEPGEVAADSVVGSPASPQAGRPYPPRSAPVTEVLPDGGRAAAPPDNEPIPLWSDQAPTPRIEGYDILRPLKQGGQGMVYLAVQRSTKRKVAVKLLLDGVFASKSARRRFEREIELVASLKHPNIIAVFDSGATPDGHDYYVMDYVRGVPITQYVREKGLSLEQVLALFATVCEAVNHAHQRGVIHRDLKPSNILVDVDGNVRVLDFGLAKTLTEPAESVVSVTGSVVGTFPYMSPEQTRANPDEIDTRSDVYSLGVMLYEALTGRHPYPVAGTVADVIRHICETAPMPPAKAWTGESGVGSGTGRRRRPGRCPIDGDLATVLLKALAKERERRYDSAGQFARDLRRYLASEPIVARRPSAGYQLRVFSRRHKALVGATLSIVLVLILSLVVVAWQLKVAREAWARADEAVDAMDGFLGYGGDDRADAGDLIRARHMFVSALDQAREHGLSGSATLAGLLELTSREGGALPLLGTYGGTGGAGGFVRPGVTKPKCVAVLRKRRMALTGGDESQLALWDLDTGRCMQLVNTQQGKVNYVAVAPDETWVVTAGENGTVLRWDLTRNPLRDPQKVIELLGRDAFKPEAAWMVAVSHDGSRVVAGGVDGQIVVCDAAGGQRTLGRCPDSVPALSFLPGSNQFAISGDSFGNIRLWDVDATQDQEVWGNPVQHYEKNLGKEDMRLHVNCLAFSPDGGALASVSFDGSLAVWDARGSGRDFRLEQRYPPVKPGDRPWRVAFSDDGSTIATAYQSGRVRLFEAQTGRAVQEFRAQEDTVEGLAYLDGQTLVSTGGARDPQGQWVCSALMVWDTGALLPQTFGGPVTALQVDDEGRVRITTPSGMVERFIGQDGRLHERRAASGPAARPWVPTDLRPGAKLPNWGRALRGTRAPGPGTAHEAGQPPAAPAAGPALPGGRAWLYTGARELQLWGTPKPRAGERPGGPVPMRVFRGHRGRVTAAAASPDGRYVVSSDEQGVVKAWDLLHPMRCRDLEQKLRVAHEQLDANAADWNALAVLGEWSAFRGRGFSARSPLAGGAVATAAPTTAGN